MFAFGLSWHFASALPFQEPIIPGATLPVPVFALCAGLFLFIRRIDARVRFARVVIQENDDKRICVQAAAVPMSMLSSSAEA